MLVVRVLLSSPPLTNTRPSDSRAMPGQNMLWTVLVMVLAVAAPGLPGSTRAVTVWSSEPEPPKRVPFHEAQVITFLLGSRAAEMGTSGRVKTWLQRPLASD